MYAKLCRCLVLENKDSLKGWCKPCPWEEEAGESGVPGHSQDIKERKENGVWVGMRQCCFAVGNICASSKLDNQHCN